MGTEIYWISFAVSLGFVAAILLLIRRRRLREQHAMLWLLLGTGMTALSLFPGLLDGLAMRIHVVYAPSLLYFIGLMGVLFILLHMTMALSALTQKTISLTQSAALRQEHVRRLERRVEELEKAAIRPSDERGRP
ncbi:MULTISPECIES: DUF2304 domain-containing protein [unclassified Paenibacillus]|uniref:DUF2304 domain-containing protein n=1 Tax=unclassified Paenibacillus TaxID=185978 RepID=UPI0009545FAE|nr:MULTISPECIES: DUF2304 domain-containing protein [unclassified Paenibacillus]ASS67216.1 DUF2304 domain-containing protein [Paenibacillus sp. RUD330]SIQ85387.1 hypothetical protein SAMN05880555_2524 [Paenibacillus sp. RU4X]SIR06238.1 hypothetical protein SAMN05880570_2523 [Paenibacillus sp. RU4T]